MRRLRRLGPTLALCALVAWNAGAAPTAAAELDHATVLVFEDDAGRPQPVKSAEDWRRRRRQVLEGMQAAMGPLPERSALPPLDLRVTARELGDGFTRETVSFASGEGDRVTAHLYRPAPPPAAGARLPGALALHPTSPLGKDVVAGRGPRPNRQYAVELAQRGYVVLAPDYPSFGGLADYDFAADRHVSGTMKGIFNHMRGVDLLCSLPEVDAERIAAIGHSLGGHNAMFAGVFDERIRVVVSSCGWTPFHDYYDGKIAGWTSDRYMPRLRDVYGLDPDRVPFDFYEVVAALAPRAFFSSSPLRDENFDVRGVRKAIPEARKVWALYSVEARLQLRTPDCEHDFPPETRREAYAFIDAQLGVRPRVDVPGEGAGEGASR